MNHHSDEDSEGVEPPGYPDEEALVEMRKRGLFAAPPAMPYVEGYCN
jgi:hypothetical protein